MALLREIINLSTVHIIDAFVYLLSRYVLVYFTILHIRYNAGLVTDEMLSLPKAPFLLVGLLEALGAAAGMAAAGNLSAYLVFWFPG